MASEDALALHTVPDEELIDRLNRLVAQSHRVEAELVAHIGEADERRLYARQAFPSMFAYCTRALHLSEAEAYRRITVARASRRYPALLAALRDGRLHLSGLALLAPLMTAGNCASLIERATHRSKREVEEIVAELVPRRDAPSAIRKLPQPHGATDMSPTEPAASLKPSPPRSAVGSAPGDKRAPAGDGRADGPVANRLFPGRVEPLSPARYKIQFTSSAELKNKLERLRSLMRHEVPDGDLAAVIERAVSEKLERLEARRFARTAAPRKTLSGSDGSPKSRHIPAAVRRAAYERTGGRCGFVDAHGRRCDEQHRLEFHHRHAFGLGGDHSPDNVGLLCPAHNRLMAEHDYGRAAMERDLRGRPGS
jgi:hypothetical protein